MAAPAAAQLADNPWLAQLPEASRGALIKATRVKTYPAGYRVHYKGEEAEGLVGLLRGEVRVSASTFAGDEIVFTRLREGEWFGEIAVLDGGVRTHDTYTTVESDIAVIPRRALLLAGQQDPAVNAALVSLLCQHTRQAFSAIDEFLVFSPEQRMALRLLERGRASRRKQLHEAGGRLGVTRNPHDGAGVALSQAELGALVGISRQSTNTILKRWETRGWVRRQYRRVEVIDAEALCDLVGRV